jgi:hypothetical protein
MHGQCLIMRMHGRCLIMRNAWAMPDNANAWAMPDNANAWAMPDNANAWAMPDNANAWVMPDNAKCMGDLDISYVSTMPKSNANTHAWAIENTNLIYVTICLLCPDQMQIRLGD